MSTEAQAVRRPFLFLLKNGPIHSLGDHIEHQLAVLSRHFDCELWAPGSIEVDTVLPSGGRVRIIKSPERPSLAQTAGYALALSRRVRSLRSQKGQRLAVIAHDPLKGGLLGVIVAKYASAPLIVEINGVYSAVENYNVAASSIALKIKMALYRHVASFTLKRAAAVRLLFPEQLRNFAELPPETPARVFFDIVSLHRFKNEGEASIVLFVGYPFVTKGVDILIKAFEAVAAEFPQWKLQIIGHDLNTRVGEMTKSPQIEVIRAMSNEKLAGYINRSGIFVLPSRSEAMGRVLLEAAAAAKPRIGARVGGIPTVIEDEKDGLLFNKEDVEELSRQLQRLMSSPSLRTQLGQAARRRIESQFSDDAYLANMVQLVELAL